MTQLQFREQRPLQLIPSRFVDHWRISTVSQWQRCKTFSILFSLTLFRCLFKVYLSYGLATTTPSEKITMVIKTKSRLAQVSINVVQIKCNSPDIGEQSIASNLLSIFLSLSKTFLLVPDTCLQRVTGNTGRVRSFGFPYQLINQDYKVCTQRIPGVTGIEVTSLILVRVIIMINHVSIYFQWKECSNTGGRIKPFFVTGIAAMSGDPVPLQEGNIFCSHDHVQLGSIESGLTTLKKCGGTFPKTLGTL